MTYLEFRKIAGNQRVIDIRNVVTYCHEFDRRRLYEWQQKGYIYKIVNDFYVFAETEPDDTLLKNIASRIYQPSYVALESAMAYYHFIPEAVFQTISMTTQRNKLLTTRFGDFRYRSIKRDLFFGYNAVEAQNDRFFISDPEKTMLDMLYFIPGSDQRAVLEGLRLNIQELRAVIDIDKMKRYLGIFSSRKMDKAFRHIKGMLND